MEQTKPRMFRHKQFQNRKANLEETPFVVKNETHPEASQVLGPQDFYTPSSQDSLDAYKYYPYTTRKLVHVW